MSVSRDIGTRGESAVVRYLTSTGWPSAERRQLRGRLDAGDVTGTPGLCIEVKTGERAQGAGDLTVAAWLEETETERTNARSDLGILILQRRGFGTARVDRWSAVVPMWALWWLDRHMTYVSIEVLRGSPGGLVPVWMTLRDLVFHLRLAGYGEVVEPPSPRLAAAADGSPPPLPPVSALVGGRA